MKIDKKNRKDICPVCKSLNTIEWYSNNLDLKHLSFTYEFSPQSQKTFRVVRCKKCTHVFCSPLPKNIYKNYEDVVDKEYLRHKKTRELSANAVLSTIKSFIPQGRLLDIGCATGDFLKMAKQAGYIVEGLELSHWSSKIAQKHGIKIYRKTLANLAKDSTKKYDVISLWGVIEHFENPLQEMKYLNKLLKPGGILVLWTGDVDGMMSRVLGRRWWYWQGQHIQYFTQKSINLLGSKSGFKEITTKIYPIAASYDQMKNSLSRYKFQRLLLPFIKIAFLLKPIWYLYLPGEMFWIAKKTK